MNIIKVLKILVLLFHTTYSFENLQLSTISSHLTEKSGSNLTLHCNSNYDPILCLWKTSYSHIYTLNNGVFAERGRLAHVPWKGCAVEILGVQKRDSGKWECEVGVVIGDDFVTASEEIVLAISDEKDEKPEPSPKQKSSSTSGIREVGDDVTMHCSGTSGVVSLCRWKTPYHSTYIVGQGIYVERGRIQWRGKDPSKDCSIRISSLEMRDAGVWTCEIGFSGESFKDIIIQTKDFKINIEAPLKLSTPTLLTENNQATLVCHANKQFDNCKWKTPYGSTFTFKDSSSSHESGRVSFYSFRSSKTDCGIMIQRLEPKDNGNWVCLVEANNNGKIHQNSSETLSLRSKGSHLEEEASSDYGSEIDYGLPPLEIDAIDYVNGDFDKVSAISSTSPSSSLPPPDVVPSNFPFIQKIDSTTPHVPVITSTQRTTPRTTKPLKRKISTTVTSKSNSQGSAKTLDRTPKRQRNYESILNNPFINKDLELKKLRTTSSQIELQATKTTSISTTSPVSTTSIPFVPHPFRTTSIIKSISSVYTPDKGRILVSISFKPSNETNNSKEQSSEDEKRKAIQLERARQRRLDKEKELQRRRKEERESELRRQRQEEELKQRIADELQRRKEEEAQIRKQQEEEELERKKVEEERLRKRKQEEEDRLKRLREEERLRRLRVEQETKRRQRKEEEDRLRRLQEEEEERLRKKKQEEERQRRLKEEEDRLKRIKEEEEERLRKKKQEEERQKRLKEEEDRLRRIKEEEERLRRIKEEEERLRRIKEEEERLRKKKQEEERQKRLKEEEDRLRRAKEEEERLKRIKEDERLKRIKEEELRLLQRREQQELQKRLEQEREEERRRKHEEHELLRRKQQERELQIRRKKNEDEIRRRKEIELQRIRDEQEKNLERQRMKDLERQRRKKDDELRLQKEEFEREKIIREHERRKNFDRKRLTNVDRRQYIKQHPGLQKKENRQFEVNRRRKLRRERYKLLQAERRIEVEDGRDKTSPILPEGLHIPQFVGRKRIIIINKDEPVPKDEDGHRRFKLNEGNNVRQRKKIITDEPKPFQQIIKSVQMSTSVKSTVREEVRQIGEVRHVSKIITVSPHHDSSKSKSNATTSKDVINSSSTSQGPVKLPDTEKDETKRDCIVSQPSHGNISCIRSSVFGEEIHVSPNELCTLSCTPGYVPLEKDTGKCYHGRLTQRLQCVKPDALLILGGRSDTYGVLSSVELITAQGVCRGAVPPLPQMRWKLIVTTIGRDKVFACGGASQFGDSKGDCWLMEFNPSPTWKETQSMKLPRDSAAVAYESNKVYVLGGSLGKLNGYTDAVDVYDPENEVWENEVIHMTSPRHSHCAVGLGNGSIFVTGGYGGLSMAERYDIADKKWTSLPELNPVRAQHGCALVDLHGEQGVIIVGGDSGGTRLGDVRFLSLQSSVWRKVAELNTARWGRPGVGVVGGRITVSAGWSGFRDLDTVEYYDEKTSAWRLTASKLQTERRWPYSTPISLSLFPKCIQKRSFG